MPKIADWTEDTRRVLHVSLEGHIDPLKGQGNFMIDPRELEVTFERHGKSSVPERVFKIKVTGERIDPGKSDHPIGIRAWLIADDEDQPDDVPGWVQELIEVFTHFEELDAQLRASVKAVKWLTGFDMTDTGETSA